MRSVDSKWHEKTGAWKPKTKAWKPTYYGLTSEAFMKAHHESKRRARKSQTIVGTKVPA